MHLLLVVLFAVALSYQVFRKSHEFCPYYQGLYTNVAAPSLVSCAMYCDKDKPGCSGFVYDEVQEQCMLHQDSHGTHSEANNTSAGGHLFLSSHKECILGYDFDVYTHTCIKVYNLSFTWSDARAHCQDDGGDLISIPTIEKWQFVIRSIKCTNDTYWVGLRNRTWLTGDIFVNVYGLLDDEMLFRDDQFCGRIRFKWKNSKIVRTMWCTYAKPFICERIISYY